MLTEGDRVVIEGAKGDRRRFNGKGGELLRLQPRYGRPDAEPFAQVRLDGRGNTAKGYRVFLPHELRRVRT